ncbi:MAG: hypothetical protein L6Q33_02050 [Bacteriovoracaceae bacterium]|nr:hypothetical protein [Bacteriovoracaceae bacterium]
MSHLAYHTDILCNQILINKICKKFDTPLYHWTSKINGDKILNSSTLLMSKAYEISDDNQEFVRGLDIIIKKLSVSNFYVFPNIKKELIERRKNKNQVVPYVTCFSHIDNNHNRMKFGDNGNGCQLKIEPLIDNNLTVINLIYDEKKFNKMIDDTISGYFDLIVKYLRDKKAIRHIIPLFLRDIFLLAICFKREQFSIEEETRIVHFEIDNKINKYYPKNLVFDPTFYRISKIN